MSLVTDHEFFDLYIEMQEGRLMPRFRPVRNLLPVLISLNTVL